MNTATNQNAEVNTYGMTVAELREQIETSMFAFIKNYDLMVMSMLSDAQEMINYDRSAENLNRQRQLINQAKYVLRYYVMDKEVA